VSANTEEQAPPGAFLEKPTRPGAVEPDPRKEKTVTLDEILQDIHALEENMLTYERKYGVISEMFYESYVSGEEPPDDARVLDWNDWAGTYEIWLRRREQYREIERLLES
jgi:hypothetical protein